jgi:hypothetical protein
MDNLFIRRGYYLFLFFSLVGLVFYTGFLFGNRERVNSKDSLITSQNPNGQSLNTISRIQQRPIEGFSNGQTVENFGQMFFLVNKKNQTEIVINLERIPDKLTLAPKEVGIPNELKVEIARRIRDSDGQDTYSYESLNLERNNAIVSLGEPVKGFRSGTFSGYIQEPVIDSTGKKGNIERIVLLSTDNEVNSIFVDKNPDLPLKVRGSTEAKIPGQPAPFFWIRL